MSSAKSKDSIGNSSKSAGASGSSASGKKSKSIGFIETTGYKPNWLETGPLTPDMMPLPPSQLSDSNPEDDNDSVPIVPVEVETESEAPGTVDLPDLDISDLGESDADLNATADVETSRDINEIGLEADAGMQEAADLAEAPPAVHIPEWSVDPQTAEDLPHSTSDAGHDDFILDEPSADSQAMGAGQAHPQTNVPAKPKKRRDRLTLVLLFVSILLIGLAALLYFLNPFTRLALQTASLARPVESAGVGAPSALGGEWCIRGDFLAGNADLPRLVDSGVQGDILNGDRVFSAEIPIPEAGTHQWQVVSCADQSMAYPLAPAWFRTETSNQPVTFLFDANERVDRLFFPIPFVVTAIDSTDSYRVVGSFQDWNKDDPSSQMTQIYSGLYQQVRKMAQPGTFEGYVIDANTTEAIDAYGRATKPIPFSFQTERVGEYVVFLLDTDRGRASVLHNMSPLMANLAFGQGYQYLSLALIGLATLILIGLIARLLVLRNRKLWLESGCPNCGQHELMRIARRNSDRYLHVVGIPAYRYRCRNCTWEGARLSEEGAAVSPGVAVSGTNIFE